MTSQPLNSSLFGGLTAEVPLKVDTGAPIKIGGKRKSRRNSKSSKGGKKSKKSRKSRKSRR